MEDSENVAISVNKMRYYNPVQAPVLDPVPSLDGGHRIGDSQARHGPGLASGQAALDHGLDP